VTGVRSLTTAAALAVAAAAGLGTAPASFSPAITALYPTAHPHGLMVTSGGWAYCEQVRPIARRTRYALLCGRYGKDGYLGPGLRSRRRLDWGNPLYLAGLARQIRAWHGRIGGSLILIGVSYSGFGVATLASHHPELRPDRLIVVDSYLDLVARRSKLPDSHETAREIDAETGGSASELRRRSVSAAGLARLVRAGTRLTAIWSISDDERRFFNGATCDLTANAQTLSGLAHELGRPVSARVTESRHGVDLWRYGARIVEGADPGRTVVFTSNGRVPLDAVCR
jgi:pimeloyl-ACP methyl ester carboxylesterase